MTRYLVFTLHAPLASFGAIAVGERRPGWDRPGRSAIVGLVAGALGIDRADDSAQLALDRSVHCAIRTDAPGRMLTDYHTAQMPKADRKRRPFATRKQELAVPEQNTVLTRRDYRTDTWHMIALWSAANPAYTLDSIADALKSPIYAPYLGRKSCPLALPLAPILVNAAGPGEAFAARLNQAKAPETHLRRNLRATPGIIAMDADQAGSHDIARIERRRDRIASRARWQFGLRAEAILRDPPKDQPS